MNKQDIKRGERLRDLKSFICYLYYCLSMNEDQYREPMREIKEKLKECEDGTM